MSAESRIGVTGLAVMGANLARNIARHDVPVALHNRTSAKTEALLRDHGDDGPMVGSDSTEEFTRAGQAPRDDHGQGGQARRHGDRESAQSTGRHPHRRRNSRSRTSGRPRHSRRRAGDLAPGGRRGGGRLKRAENKNHAGRDQEAYGSSTPLEAIAAQVDGDPAAINRAVVGQREEAKTARVRRMQLIASPMTSCATVRGSRGRRSPGLQGVERGRSDPS